MSGNSEQKANPPPSPEPAPAPTNFYARVTMLRSTQPDFPRLLTSELWMRAYLESGISLSQRDLISEA